MSLHLSLRLRAHIRVLYRCTSLALQPAVGVQHLCSQTGTFSHHLSLQPPNPMQGKIKGHGTIVRFKPVCTWGGGGTRGRGYRAVCYAVPASEKKSHPVDHRALIYEAHATSGSAP